MALTWVKIANLKGPKGDAGTTEANARFDAIEAKNTAQDGRLTTNETKNTAQDGRLNAIEAKDVTQDSRLDDLPNQYVPLSRGTLTAGTDWNTLTGAQHVGTYSVSGTYPNAPTFSGTGTLVVERGGFSTNYLSVVQRLTVGSVLTWREAVDASTGSWSGWEQAETLTGAATKNAVQDGRLTTNEAKNAVQDTRLTTIENATIVYTNGYVQPPVSYTPDANTKGLWRFDDTLTDSSGNGYTLSQVSTYAGTYSTDAKFGTKSLNGGLYQNTGADTFLSSTGTTGGTLTTGTVECWVRSTPHTATKVAVSHRNWFWLGMAANGTPLAKYGNGANEKTITGTTVLTATPYSSTIWYHLALVFDGANGVRLYVNGKLEGSNVAVEVVGDQSPGPGFTIGGLQGAGAPAFNWELSSARIDEVRLSNVARYAATQTYPARPAGLKAGSATFIGPVIPPERQPFDQWIKTETI